MPNFNLMQLHRFLYTLTIIWKLTGNSRPFLPVTAGRFMAMKMAEWSSAICHYVDYSVMNSGFAESMVTALLSRRSYALTLHNHRVFCGHYKTPATSLGRDSHVLWAIGRVMSFIMVSCCKFNRIFFRKLCLLIWRGACRKANIHEACPATYLNDIHNWVLFIMADSCRSQ